MMDIQGLKKIGSNMDRIPCKLHFSEILSDFFERDKPVAEFVTGYHRFDRLIALVDFKAFTHLKEIFNYS